MEVGLVRSVDIDQEMQQAYLDYAMSTIMARALPDARDGLKPVHRRILYAMYDMGMRPESPFKKSARIVGEVLGKYHPHGDMAVYEAMARMAQDFSMRCLLVEGQGNFGSVDGDPPAAMRYTEARLASPAMHMLADIRKDTVDFSENFDGSLTEPDVLPAALPNLLVNGATGIAVGMSTSIPPHNLGEVVDALMYMLANWEKLDDIDVENLMRFIQGPDFPTGGIIIPGEGDNDLKVAYGTGRGRVVVQARAHYEEMSRGRNRIIVTELPYMTNKSSLIERIAELAREGRLEGLADLRDESDRQGLRIVIELTKTADPQTVLHDLYRMTPMRSTFGIILLALVDGEPRMLSLKQALRVYLDHRLVVIHRRAEYELERLKARAHILEGLRIALKNLDEVIDLIRKAADADTARDRLMKRFRLTEIQAQSILDMQLRRLAALERKKIEEEYKEVLAEIKNLEALLMSPVKMRQVVSEELAQVKQAYADRRRTQIANLKSGGKAGAPLLTTTDLVADKTVWISAMPDGVISRSLDEKPPRLSGSSAPMWSFQAGTRHTLYLVTEQGEATALPVHALPEAESPTEGIPAHRLSPLTENDRLTAMFALPSKDQRPEEMYVVTATQQGMVKRSAVSELPGPSAHLFTLVKVNEGDQLGWVRLTDGKAELILAAASGMAIRFKEDEVRPMGLVAAGVGGIKLVAGDVVIGMELVPPRGEIFLITADGKAKRVPAEQFPTQGRYGLGVLAWKLPRTSQLAGLAAGMPDTRLTLHLDRLAPKALRLDDAPLQNRTAQGKNILDLKTNLQVLRLTVPGYSGSETTGAAREPKPSTARRKHASAAAPEQDEPATQTSFEALLETPAKPAQRSSTARTTAKAAPSEPAVGKSGAKKTTVPRQAPKALAENRNAAKQPAKKTSAVKSESTQSGATKLKPAAKSPPTSSKTAVGESAAQTTTTDKSTSRKVTASKPDTQKPAASTSSGQKKSTVKSAVKPAVKPAAKQPADKKPAAKQPADKKPAAKQPADKKPVAKQPADKKPAVSKPAVIKPAAKTPSTQKPPVRKPR